MLHGSYILIRDLKTENPKQGEGQKNKSEEEDYMIKKAYC